MKSNPISPEELARARVAAKHHNEVLGAEILTPEFLAEGLKLIDERLATKWHNEALAVIAARRRKVVIYDAVNIKRLGLIIASRAPKRLRRHVKTSNSSDDDDHDSNLLVNPPRDPAYSRGPFLFNTNDYAW